MFAYHTASTEFTDRLCDLGFGKYTDISGDVYDCSIEFHKVENDERLSEEQQKFVFDAGFSIAYLNHENGWQTHYHWGAEFRPLKGWRRLRTDKGFTINYWPEGWGDQKTGLCANWLTSGYMTIEPDA